MAKFGASQDGEQIDAPTLVRALIVTGDRRTASLIGEMLQASWSDGLVVAHAGQLTDATHELLEHAASCVLLDLSEHEDRIAAVEQLRTAAPDVPIVVLAERADEDEAVIVVKSGAQDYLVRSELSPALLRRAVMYAIERKRLEAQLAHRALHDPLTGLPNRALFLDRLGVALDRSRRNNASIAVLFLDVDNFKQINDSLGHAAGDRLLSGLADRLQSMLRPMDTVARFGGDEFTFLFEELTSEREVILIAERIGRAVRLPIHLEEADTEVTVSIGISIVSDPTMAAEAVIREADSAMYRAKQLGRSRYELFDETSRQRAVDRLELEGALRQALERSELRVHFQPKLSFEAGALRVTGLEALLRWQHPTRGMLAPGEFLQLAEDSGLMLEIGQYVLAHSLHQLLIWREHHPDLTITMNVSARQLEDMSFVTLARRAARGGGRRPPRGLPRHHRARGVAKPGRLDSRSPGAEGARREDRNRRLRHGLVIAVEPQAAGDRLDQDPREPRRWPWTRSGRGATSTRRDRPRTRARGRGRRRGGRERRTARRAARAGMRRRPWLPAGQAGARGTGAGAVVPWLRQAADHGS